MIRLFAGIALPEAAADALVAIQGGVPGARWIAPENMHITLAFIGEVDPERAEELAQALDEAPLPGPFEVTLKGTGVFERGRKPYAIWAGVEDNPALVQCQKRVAAALTGAGVDLEKRKYFPHVTIARMKQPDRARLEKFLKETALFRADPFRVDRVTLFSSHLGKAGAQYTREVEFELGE